VEKVGGRRPLHIRGDRAGALSHANAEHRQGTRVLKNPAKIHDNSSEDTCK